jgi:hypothetical protein
MDALTSASLGARRNEDIALDLLKFVAATAGIGRPAAPSTGFSGAAGAKPDEHVNQLLELYSRCLKAVEGQEPDKSGQGTEPEKGNKEKAAKAPQGWTPQS